MWFLYLALLAQSHGLEDGNKALDAKQYERAIEFFQQAAAADPKDFAAPFQLALTYSLLGRDADAIPLYETALGLQPGLYEAELNLGLSQMRTHHPSNAMMHFQSALQRRPQEFRPALGLAQALYDTNRFPEAEAAYKNAATLDSRSAAAQSGWGMSLVKQNRADDAAPHVQQAFVLDRSYRSGFVPLAELYESLGRNGEAIALYRLFPDDAVALERLGVLLSASNQLTDAIQTLEAVVEKMPTSARQLALAQAYIKNKQLDKAQAVVGLALQGAPDDIELRMFYARLLRDQRNFSAAIEQFASITRAKPENVEAWNELASLLVIAERYPQAIAAFDRLRALGAESTGNYFFRALAYDRLRQRPEAIESYSKFLAASQGTFPDQEFQARQRVRILEKQLKENR